MTGSPDNILVVNPGSSSIKFRLYSRDGILEEGDIETKSTLGIRKSVEMLYDRIKKYDVKRFAYRVVYGNFKSPKVINRRLLSEISKLREFDPLHTDKTVYIIKFLMKKLGGKHLACFDSYFHRTMPDKANMYALPPELSAKYRIKRYGFHGLAHESLYRDAERFSGKKYKRVISCQLGSGVSLCAIRNGKSIDTTMGFTPLEGLMMETRSGDIDPAVIPFLNRRGMSIEKIKNILEKDSGLFGVSGIKNSKDIIHQRRKNPKARLAFKMFVYHVRKAIGAYIAALGGVDLIVLGGGISRSKDVREKVLEGLEEFGIRIDKKKIKGKTPVKVSSGKVDIIVLETDEQKLIFELAKRFFK